MYSLPAHREEYLGIQFDLLSKSQAVQRILRWVAATHTGPHAKAVGCINSRQMLQAYCDSEYCDQINELQMRLIDSSTFLHTARTTGSKLFESVTGAGLFASVLEANRDHRVVKQMHLLSRKNKQLETWQGAIGYLYPEMDCTTCLLDAPQTGTEREEYWLELTLLHTDLLLVILPRSELIQWLAYYQRAMIHTKVCMLLAESDSVEIENCVLLKKHQFAPNSRKNWSSLLWQQLIH
ncbi:MAG TPA: hypothetical protein DCZ03_05115 [Gammaproteobacteria bacterium]|nr:hypothetical protein [Gammaproteobacteria bacterium]